MTPIHAGKRALALVMAVGGGLALAQATASPADAPPSRQGHVEQEAASAVQDEAFSRYCLRHTGSRIRPRGRLQRCSAMGRSYDREELSRTGAHDLADALRRLDAGFH